MLYGIVIIGLTGTILMVYAEYLALWRRYEKRGKSAADAETKYNADLDTLSREIDRLKIAHEQARGELVELVNTARQDAAAWQTESLKLKATNDSLEATVMELKLTNMSFEKRNQATYDNATTAIQLLWELVDQTGIKPPQLGPPWYVSDEETPAVTPFAPLDENEPL